MGSSFPSFQSFYQHEVSQDADCPQHQKCHTGDGFTGQEISLALDPVSKSWSPNKSYHKQAISLLKTGPGYWEITGRIVNFIRPGKRSNPQLSTQHQCLILLSDETGVLSVRMVYPKPFDFDFIFGQRITIYTTSITSSYDSEPGDIPHVNFCTTISPGRNSATHIIFHQDTTFSDHTCRTPPPLHFQPGLMCLRSFISSGFDVSDVQILVCVRSVGPQKNIQRRKREATVDLVEVGIFDDTATAVLILWGDHAASAKSFIPNQTLLLISQPTCNSITPSSTKGQPAAELSIGYNSMVFIDPKCPQSKWLSTRITEISRRDSIVTIIPESIWDAVDIGSSSATRGFLTIAEADEQVRQDPGRDFMGTMRLVIMEVNIIALCRKAMFCCAEW
ncbi:hypothetical protein PFICI_07227 [Pestalotiopsis fici W106-1]|uniref:Replication protein A OB domain-containing protein n=1 Tax=Pestalotiopsis fici (strain W106-1 / CGMCC3.15140) TaxID=1229662 RepID=W3X872_PESFW|nr:uncharacterized protein PFICI_07227 [Pestalotiopsis fici W106-1]ETS82225.1 hypothetical protein PFICI_07227 [Pestalotiopsis fici W106-1]